MCHQTRIQRAPGRHRKIEATAPEGLVGQKDVKSDQHTPLAKDEVRNRNHASHPTAFSSRSVRFTGSAECRRGKPSVSAATGDSADRLASLCRRGSSPFAAATSDFAPLS